MSHVFTLVPVMLVTFAALAPPRRPYAAARLAFWLGYLVNEFPLFALAWLVTSALLAHVVAGVGSPAWLASAAMTGVTAFGLLLVARRGPLAGPALATALARALNLHEQITRHVDRPGGRRVPVSTVLCPSPLRPRAVQRIANIDYGPAGPANRLDLYRNRSTPAGAPVLIHFHGGHFRTGNKSRETRALLYRLASQGWVCISANYRLRRAGRFPAPLIDAKRVIAWVRREGAQYGADPSVVFVAGSSAGAHLASMAALTPNDPVFQPGFEQADTAVSGAVCLYGYYGSRGPRGPVPSSPKAYIRPDAPPFFIAHGDNDTLAPIGGAASFAAALRSVSASPVVYAQLPGAQHGFDLLHSVRFEHTVRGIALFAAWVRAKPGGPSTGTSSGPEPSSDLSSAKACTGAACGSGRAKLVSGTVETD
jgi:acetyl esterase/lipase